MKLANLVTSPESTNSIGNFKKKSDAQIPPSGPAKLNNRGFTLIPLHSILSTGIYWSDLQLVCILLPSGYAIFFRYMVHHFFFADTKDTQNGQGVTLGSLPGKHQCPLLVTRGVLVCKAAPLL